MRKKRAPEIGRLIRNDLFKAVGFAVFLYAVYAYIDGSSTGQHLRDFQSKLLQEGLDATAPRDPEFQAGGRRLPVVIDISAFHRDKRLPTNREVLDLIVSELKRAEVRAIGIDLDFAAQGSTNGLVDDFVYLARWKGHRNVRVGVFERAVMRRQEWLGLGEFAELAAGIALPKDDPIHAFLFTRRIDKEDLKVQAVPQTVPTSQNTQEQCLIQGECLVNLPAALLLIPSPVDVDNTKEKTLRFLKGILQKSKFRTAEDSLQVGSYLVDYSYRDEINKDIITLTYPEPDPTGQKATRGEGASEGLPVGWEVSLRNQLSPALAQLKYRIVLVGDLEDASDHFCAVIQKKPISGLLMHASSLASLERGLLREIDPKIMELVGIGMSLLILGLILGMRLLHTYSKPLHKWDYYSIEILSFGSMAVVVYLVCKWKIRVLDLYVTNFLWVAAALFIHPFLTEPFYRTCKALAKALGGFVVVFAGRRTGGNHAR